MKSVKKIFVPTIYLIAILSVVGCILLTIMSINKYLTESEKFDYSINGLIDNEVKPVQGEDNTKNICEVKTFLRERSPAFDVSNFLGYINSLIERAYRLDANYLIFGSVVNLILNLLLIPNFGAEGAAVASVIAEAMVSVLYVHFSCGYGDFALLVKTGGKKLLVGFVMFVVIFAMNNLSLNSLVLISNSYMF